MIVGLFYCMDLWIVDGKKDCRLIFRNLCFYCNKIDYKLIYMFLKNIY